MTNQLTQLLADLAQLAKQATQVKSVFDHTKYQPVKLSVTQQTFTSVEAITQFISSQHNITGWVQETSDIHKLHNEPYKWRSIPLNAEWCNEEKTSFAMDYLGQNIWQVTHYHLSTDGEPTHLAESLTQRIADDTKNVLRYQRLWKIENQQAPVADIAVFVGFEGE